MRDIYISKNGDLLIKYSNFSCDYDSYIKYDIYIDDLRLISEGIFPNMLDVEEFYKKEDVRLLREDELVMYKLLNKI